MAAVWTGPMDVYVGGKKVATADRGFLTVHEDAVTDDGVLPGVSVEMECVVATGVDMRGFRKLILSVDCYLLTEAARTVGHCKAGRRFRRRAIEARRRIRKVT